MSVRLPDHLDLIATAPDGIPKLRGLILELAVRGKLVPQDPNDEPASELLKRIAVERARLEASKRSQATPLGDDVQISFELPETWQWVRFEEIAQHNSGKTLDKSRNSGEPRPYITTSNLYWGRFELDSVRQMLINDDELQRCTARKNDLLICEGGEAGRAAVWPHDDEICFQNHVHRARLFGGINPYFAYRFFEKLNASGEIDLYRKGVGISNMSGKALASIPFPLPPLAEQHRIVAKVDELMALCDRLEAEQADAETAHARLVATLLGTLTQSVDAAELAANWQRLAEHFVNLFTTEASLDALKQTILQLAVMGKLVPQDPNDEPASELLKRIARERARLEAEGVCKKSKATPPVGEDAQPFTVPDGWMWVRIDDVSQLVTDGEHATPTRTSDRSAIPLVTAKNVRDGYLDYTHTDFVPKDVAEKCWKRCKPTLGDILLVSVGATLGRLSVLDHDRDMVLVRSVTVIRPCLVDRSFFATALRSPIVQDSIWRGVKQSAQPCLYLAQSSSLAIPLPPLAEQHRIVAKVNELLTLCDRLKADLADSRARQERLAATLIESALQAA
jgi:type I restriction enzyme, S subunit